MKWSLKLGKLLGIEVYVHFTFLLLLVFLGFYFWDAHQSIEAAIRGVAFMVAFFGCVFLHELGHALMARRYGIKTRDITLLPIGGIARLESMPEKPMQELRVALAGPAVAGGKIVGLLTMENISEKIMLNTAMAHQPAGRPLLLEKPHLNPQRS